MIDSDGQKIDKTEWHRVVSFQPGLVDMLERHARKGRLVYVSGVLQTRRWRKEGEESDRFSTEILLAPGSRVQFLDRPNGNGAAAEASESANGSTTPADGAPAQAGNAEGDEIPF